MSPFIWVGGLRRLISIELITLKAGWVWLQIVFSQWKTGEGNTYRLRLKYLFLLLPSYHSSDAGWVLTGQFLFSVSPHGSDSPPGCGSMASFPSPLRPKEEDDFLLLLNLDAPTLFFLFP